MSDTATYKTGDILKRTGISRQILQQYLEMGLLKEKKRTGGGHRIFGEETVKRIELIRKLNRSGYPLRDIRETFKRGFGGNK